MTIQSRKDTYVDPKSSELLVETSQGAVKEVVWEDGMWHHLSQEPGFEKESTKPIGLGTSLGGRGAGLLCSWSQRREYFRYGCNVTGSMWRTSSGQTRYQRDTRTRWSHQHSDAV
eukprot:scaffold3443_cov404-Prasinococcus_capsulatus_cf.AAC.18